MGARSRDQGAVHPLLCGKKVDKDSNVSDKLSIALHLHKYYT